MLTWILSSSVLILAVLGLRLMFRGRISHRMIYALWALVLLRLLIPGSILHSTASVANLVSEFTEPPVFSAPVLEQEEALEQVLTQQQITRNEFDTLPVPQQNVYTQQADALVESSRQEAQAEIQKQETRYYSTRQILLALWILGAVVTAGCLLWANLRFARALSRSRRKVEGQLPVYRSAAAESPCLFGLFRPAVYLPEDLPEGDIPYVLAHEQTHLHHLDHIWSALRCLCLALHWFNPLVWIAVKVSRTDSELACDEGALERLGEESREQYGQALIRMSRGQAGNLLLTATTMTADKRTLYARIKAIAQKPRIIALAVVLLAITAAIVVGCTFTGPETPADPTEPPETTEPTETTSPTATEPSTEPTTEPTSFPLRNALDGNFELDYENRHIMALGNVEVKADPSVSAETVGLLHYEFVTVQAATYTDDGKWALVSYAISDGFGNMGWVRLSDLAEYTEETKELLRYPVTVSDFCKDVDTGKLLSKGHWVLLSIDGEYATITTKVSGRDNRVKLSDIVYPDVTLPTALAAPTESSIFAEHIVIQEADLPSYKTTSEENFVVAQETYEGFRADHIHFGTNTSGSGMPYDYGCFWTRPSITSGYQLWAAEDGELKKLDRVPASMDGTVFGLSVSFKSAGDTAFFVDPFDGETVYVQMPEGWEGRTDMHWYRSYDGRMMYSAMNSNRGVFALLVFDGRTNRLYEIERADRPYRFQVNIAWSHDDCLVLYSEDGKEISVYTFEKPSTAITVEPIVIYEEELPSYDLDSKKNFVISQETYDGFRVDHVHVGTGRSGERLLYDEGYFWISTDETIWLQGNRYELWVIENGRLKKLDSKVLSMEVTALGKTLELYTEYVSHKGETFFTHIPADPRAYVVSAEDSSRWVVHLYLESDEGEGSDYDQTYWVLLDPETGEITEFLQNFDPTVFRGKGWKKYNFVTWAEGGFVARIYAEGEGYYFFDTEKGTITENYPYENPEEPEKKVTFQRRKEWGQFLDSVDGETVVFKLPEGSKITSRDGATSPDGRMAAIGVWDEQRNLQLLYVFDGKTNQIYEIHRSPFPQKGEENLYWSSDNCLCVVTENYYDAETKYDFSKDLMEEISVYTFE